MSKYSSTFCDFYIKIIINSVIVSCGRLFLWIYNNLLLRVWNQKHSSQLVWDTPIDNRHCFYAILFGTNCVRFIFFSMYFLNCFQLAFWKFYLEVGCKLFSWKISSILIIIKGYYVDCWERNRWLILLLGMVCHHHQTFSWSYPGCNLLST